MKQKWYSTVESFLAFFIGSIFTFLGYQLWGFWCLVIPILLLLFYFRVFILWLLSLLIMPLVIYFVGRQIGTWATWSWVGLYAPIGIYYISWFLMERELHKRAKEGISPEELAKLHFEGKFRKVDEHNFVDIEKLEEEIKTYEDMMFGLLLYQETSPKPIQVLQRMSHKNMKTRGDEAIQEAKTILKDAKQDRKVHDRIKSFQWPVILEDMKHRIGILLECYEKLFPGRPREKALSKEEIIALRNEAVNKT